MSDKARERDRQEREFWDWMTLQTLAERRRARQSEVHTTIRRGRSKAKRRARACASA